MKRLQEVPRGQLQSFPMRAPRRTAHGSPGSHCGTAPSAPGGGGLGTPGTPQSELRQPPSPAVPRAPSSASSPAPAAPARPAPPGEPGGTAGDTPNSRVGHPGDPGHPEPPGTAKSSRGSPRVSRDTQGIWICVTPSPPGHPGTLDPCHPEFLELRRITPSPPGHAESLDPCHPEFPGHWGAPDLSPRVPNNVQKLLIHITPSPPGHSGAPDLSPRVPQARVPSPPCAWLIQVRKRGWGRIGGFRVCMASGPPSAPHHPPRS